MGVSKPLREHSKINYHSESTAFESINCGSFQRIADATELMAQGYIRLQNERDQFKRSLAMCEQRCAQLRRSVSTYKGIVRRLKNASK